MTINEINQEEEVEVSEEIQAAIEEHGDAFVAYRKSMSSDEKALESFEEAYSGEWETEEKFAEQLMDEEVCYTNPDYLANYLDYEKFAIDLFMGDFFSIEIPSGGIFVFRTI